MSTSKSTQTQPPTPIQGGLAPELIAMLGKIPDAVMADLVKAHRLNGRKFATLIPGELEVFDFFRMQGRKYRVVATVISDADPLGLARADSQQEKDKILRRADSTVHVAVYENLASLAAARWNATADEYNQWDSLGQDEKDELIAEERQFIESPDTHP